MKKFFVTWILPGIFWIPAMLIFLDGREMTYSIMGMYLLMTTFNTIGDAISMMGRELD